LNAIRLPESAASSTAPAEPSLAVGLLYDDDDAREALHDAVLLPLIDYDENHNSDLVRTLDAFLSHNGTWNTTAAELQVHVNTLRYRLARVEDLTGRSLDSMGDRVDFFVALRTRR
jgi:DNA-binding PucR family transcriptional regulator